MIAQEPDRADHVVDVDPAEPLPSSGAVMRRVAVAGRIRSDTAVAAMIEPPAVELRPADAEAREPEQQVRRRAVAQHDRHPQGDAPGAGQVAREELALPGAGHIDRESGAELAGRLRLRAVGRVTVDRGGAGVHPDPRRPTGLRHRLAQGPGRVDPRAQDLVAIRVRVAAVDRRAREIDEEVRPLDRPRDGSRIAPVRGSGSPDRAHLEAVFGEGAHQHTADEAARSGDDGDACHSASARIVKSTASSGKAP